MDKKEDKLGNLSKGFELHEKLYQEFQEKMKNPKKAEAYKLREEAWNYIFTKKNYDPEKAMKLIIRAAEIDEEYLPQIQLVKNEIDRKARKGRVNIKKAINKVFLPRIRELGFFPYVFDCRVDNHFIKTNEWKQDVSFIKQVENEQIHIDIGRTKFGNALGVSITKIIDKEHVDYLEHSTDVNYSNQNELENVLLRLLDNIKIKLSEWLKKS